MPIIDEEEDEDDFWGEGGDEDFEEDIDEPESFDIKIPLRDRNNKIDKKDRLML